MDAIHADFDKMDDVDITAGAGNVDDVGIRKTGGPENLDLVGFMENMGIDMDAEGDDDRVVKKKKKKRGRDDDDDDEKDRQKKKKKAKKEEFERPDEDDLLAD